MNKILLISLISIIILSCNENNKSSASSQLTEIAELTSDYVSNKEILLGTYSSKINGRPVVKVLKRNENYYVSFINQKGVWGEEYLCDAELNDKLCENLKFNDCSEILYFAKPEKHGGVFYVKKDTKNSYKTFKTGYFLYLPGLPDLHKIK